MASLGRDTHFVFMGDSKTRQKYEALVKQVDSSGKMYPSLQYSKTQKHPHENYSFKDQKIRLRIDYIWCPRADEVMMDNFKQWKVWPIILSILSFHAARISHRPK